MASFFRRLTGRDEDRTKVVNTSAGPIRFSKEESEIYSHLWSVVDHDEDGHAGGSEGALFLRRSQLNDDQLREVWRLASGGSSKPALVEDDFLVACKLVATVQAGNGCSLEDLYEHQAIISLHETRKPVILSLLADNLPLADFQWGVGVDMTPGPFPEVQSDEISVTISNPQSVGSSINKHTVYSVSLSTSLSHFPVKDTTVVRRYSDFHWLHERLCATLPSVILPLFPGKKSIGKMDNAFVQQRMADLESYMAQLIRHPRVVNSFDLVVFLTNTTKGLKAAMEYVRLMASEESEGDSVLSQLMHGGGQPLVIQADEEFVNQRAFHSAALARLQATTAVSDRLSTASHASADHLVQLGNSQLAVSEAERRGESAGAGAEAARDADNKAAQAIRDLSLGGQGGETGEGGDGGETGEEGGGAAGSQAIVSRDAEAHSAFMGHMHARVESEKQNEIDSMFSDDFDDPLAHAHHSASPSKRERTPSNAAAGDESPTATLQNLFRSVGSEALRAGHMRHDHFDRLEQVLYEPVRLEQRRETEIKEAADRREQAVNTLQASHALLQRRRKAYQSAASANGKEAAVQKAHALVERSEAQLRRREEELDFITAEIKREMDRVMRARRAILARRIQEFADLQKRQAAARQKLWADLARTLSVSEEEIEERKQAMRDLAVRGREKGRTPVAPTGGADEEAAAGAGEAS